MKKYIHEKIKKDYSAIEQKETTANKKTPRICYMNEKIQMNK